uniref:Vacuolar protein sorting-associated protein 28 homolog n=1 Tax=Phaeomonas parva TaxID=124430 RepID=A0A7S1UKK1_9STRA|mmetsp:Transcript_9847/g.28930  ORF Transcript_9847/g.28930 Transcript_9847/m.28930 type:complete len:204 (+) Transcript_9847:253-864(+)|eukprot:CAMPEP_0118870996 /NCGR_PEP_ID=MMETSP1163-20130328/13724_1 /TAXON_ID=124430 /ORGANISM="Phaeomonas parva, Strain CCMP2877" /LENGTH=203 /DNA_ID=CAMNT_0006806055 /DNA_START=251 /DNA_END=862 /DNA_ORIENTATION=-
MAEVKLYSNSRARRTYDDMADLFAIIKTTEHLEIAFGRDAISEKEYETRCQRLISQFETTESALRSAGVITDVNSFCETYQVECPRALNRLVVVGKPATVGRGEAVRVAETTQHFITTMDVMQLGQCAADNLQPPIAQLVASLTRVPGLPADFEGTTKLQGWLATLNGMRAVDELSEDQSRQLEHDLESSYSAFHRFLKSGAD